MEHGASGSASRQERTRLKNIEWTAYESVHKKYLNLDTKPKLKNHYRAHRLSFWLNLVPDLHKPGNDDVPDSHHQLDEAAGDDADQDTLNDVTVKPINPPRQGKDTNYLQGSSIFTMMNLTGPATRSVNGSKAAVASSQGKVHASIVDDAAVGGDGSQGGNGGGNSGQEDGFAAYSTALSVTIAIGCSLLILNVLIFAGVYYQRDKTRLNDTQHHHQHKKRSENGQGGGGGGNGSGSGGGQMPNNICGDLDVHTKGDPSSILGHHHQLAHHQMPPPEFADLPQRAPPPPKHLKSHPEGQMIPSHALQLLGGGGGGGGSVSGGILVGTLQKKSSLKPSNNNNSTHTLTKNTNSHNMMMSQQGGGHSINNNNNNLNNVNNMNSNSNQMDELRV